MQLSDHPELQVQYHWTAGSMPPPHHYEFSIYINPDLTGKINFCPDYPAPNIPLWEEDFTFSASQLQDLYNLIDKQGLFKEPITPSTEHNVGGSLEWATITIPTRQISIPSRLQPKDSERLSPIYKTIRNMVPVEIFNGLRNRRQKYEEDYQD